ncbi:MAG: arginine--tRNA ligase [Candidatus Nealsonbacteria bacterium]|nr:arginine--tRNA ligase [Candidatus Nealsonbacteria bacterium]
MVSFFNFSGNYAKLEVMIRDELIQLVERAARQARLPARLDSARQARLPARLDSARQARLPARQASFGAREEIRIDRPAEESHGDYSTNFALQIAKAVKISPQQIAAHLQSHILSLRPDLFEKIEIVEPGFINFFISAKYLQNQVATILEKKEKFGHLNLGRSKKTNVEFISANPTGPLHVGNGRSAFSGDVLANVLAAAGYKVVREYFINDAKNSKQIIELGKTALGKGEVYLSEYLKLKIQSVRWRTKLTEGDAGFLLAKEVQADTKALLEKKLKIKFDKWISEEKDLYQKNKVKKTLEWLKQKNLVYQKEGAWWVKSSQFGDDKDWVVIRESGEPTYLLSDIAYHKDKIDRGFEMIIDIWGADHQAHVQKMKAAVGMLGYQGQLDILVLQLVTLKGGEKLSKRKGQVIMLEDLIDEIGLDAARFFYLQKSLDTHMEIDIGLAKEQSQKNPVYYVQYAHARICSILAKANAKNAKPLHDLLNHPSELRLIKQLLKLPEVIEDTANDYQLQRLPYYAVELAMVFHQFYQDCQVISEDKKLTQARLFLVLSAKTALKNTLSLMGVSAPRLCPGKNVAATLIKKT